jgi:hypothetical protein
MALHLARLSSLAPLTHSACSSSSSSSSYLPEQKSSLPGQTLALRTTTAPAAELEDLPSSSTSFPPTLSSTSPEEGSESKTTKAAASPSGNQSNPENLAMLGTKITMANNDVTPSPSRSPHTSSGSSSASASAFLARLRMERKKRRRTSTEQLNFLDRYFEAETLPSLQDRTSIAEELGMSPR